MSEIYYIGDESMCINTLETKVKFMFSEWLELLNQQYWIDVPLEVALFDEHIRGLLYSTLSKSKWYNKFIWNNFSVYQDWIFMNLKIWDQIRNWLKDILMKDEKVKDILLSRENMARFLSFINWWTTWFENFIDYKQCTPVDVITLFAWLNWSIEEKYKQSLIIFGNLNSPEEKCYWDKNIFVKSRFIAEQKYLQVLEQVFDHLYNWFEKNPDIDNLKRKLVDYKLQLYFFYDTNANVQVQVMLNKFFNRVYKFQIKRFKLSSILELRKFKNIYFSSFSSNNPIKYAINCLLYDNIDQTIQFLKNYKASCFDRLIAAKSLYDIYWSDSAAWIELTENRWSMVEEVKGALDTLKNFKWWTLYKFRKLIDIKNLTPPFSPARNVIDDYISRLDDDVEELFHKFKWSEMIVLGKINNFFDNDFFVGNSLIIFERLSYKYIINKIFNNKIKNISEFHEIIINKLPALIKKFSNPFYKKSLTLRLTQLKKTNNIPLNEFKAW